MPGPAWLTQLYAALRGPLPTSLWPSLCASRAWRDWLATLRQGEVGHWSDGIAALAALAPRGARSQLRSALADLPPELTLRAFNALILFDIIDAA
jgi:hypothetical protein